jgi:hypothetical protein
MQTRNVVFPAGHAQWADVGTPQVGNLVGPSYQSGILSDMVGTGRAKSASNSEQVPGLRVGPEAPQERWSRGCRRAFVSFWFWQWSRLSPPAPKKKKLPWTRSPRKSWKPASTSNFPERACRRLRPGGPAPIFGLLRLVAVCRPNFPDIASLSRHALWAVPQLSPIRAVDCHDRRQTRC